MPQPSSLFARLSSGGLLLTGLLLAQPSWAQQEFVQKFSQGAVLLTSGDTLQGAVELHRSRDLVMVRLADGRVVSPPTGSVKILAMQREQLKEVKLQGMKPTVVPEPEYVVFPTLSRTQGRQPLSPSKQTSATAPVQPHDYGPALQQLPKRAAVVDTPAVRIFRTYMWNQGGEAHGRQVPGFFEQLTNGPLLLVRRQRLVNYSPVPNAALTKYYDYPLTEDQFFVAQADGRLTALRNPREDLLALVGERAGQVDKFAKKNRLSFTYVDGLTTIVTYANSLLDPAAQ